MSEHLKKSYTEQEVVAALDLQEKILIKKFRFSRYIQVWISAWFGFMITGSLLVKGVGEYSMFIAPSIILFSIYVLDETVEPWIRKMSRKIEEKNDIKKK